MTASSCMDIMTLFGWYVPVWVDIHTRMLILSTEDVHHNGAVQRWRAVGTAQKEGLLQRRGTYNVDYVHVTVY